MECVEVKRDTSGTYRITGEPEEWGNVKENLIRYKRGPDATLIGWNPYTTVYTVTDEFGDIRYYFVAE